MTIKEIVNSDLHVALKGEDSLERETLRMLLAAFKNEEISFRTKAGDDLMMPEESYEAIVKKEVKKRKDAIIAFKDGNRPDLAEREEKELTILKRYLPEQLSDEALKEIVEKSLGGMEPDNFGEAMRLVMKEVAGRADGSAVSAAVRAWMENK